MVQLLGKDINKILEERLHKEILTTMAEPLVAKVASELSEMIKARAFAMYNVDANQIVIKFEINVKNNMEVKNV